MPITSRRFPTVQEPIPEWKGTEDLPDILTISGQPPEIDSIPETLIDFHCAETTDKDGGIGDSNIDPEVYKYELIEGTKYDDQS